VDKRPFAVISIFFIIGIILGKFFPDIVRFHHIFITTSIFILASFVFFRYERSSNIFLFLSVTFFASLLYLNSNIHSNNHISHFLKEDSLKIEIVGVVKGPELTRRPYFGKISSSYLFEIEGIKIDNKWLNIKGLANISIQTEKPFKYSDKLLVKGTIRKSREYLRQQNIYALIYTKEDNITLLSNDYKSNPILRHIYLIREKLKNQIIENMPLASGAFLRAILLGDRSELSKDIQTSFKHSGTIHILAISGLHVAFITLIILYLLRFLRIPRIPCYIFTMLFLIGFALLTLSRPSVVRAVVMASIFLIGMLLGRRVDVYNSLGVAALFILIKNPKDLFNIGFQLSFLAVLSIIYIAPRLMRLIREDVNFYARRWFYMPLAVSISAFTGTAPLILYYFKIITPIAIVANLLIIPTLFILLIGGLSFLMLGWVPFLGGMIVLFNNLLIQAIFYLTDFFSSLKFGHFYLG